MTDTAQQTSTDTILARLVVDKGLASEADVQDCVEQQRAAEPGQALGDLLVAQKIITRRQLERLRPSIEDEQPSQKLPGFKVISKLGAGAMAKVYKARQLSLDRTVAIKVLPRKFLSNQDFIDRFYAEGRAAAKLNHPNIVQAYDVGNAGEYHYFVMEYVDGNSVYEQLQDIGRYEEARATQIMIEIASALEHAHAAGLIHRDVKPKNIMITQDGVAQLADMGLARAVSDKQLAAAEQGKAYGTPYYISPEQIRGEVNIDFRADIYSLGATFYHMVTGRVPFDGPNPTSVMHKHLKTSLTPPDHVNPNLSNGIGEIIEMAMSKSRRKRYQSISDMLADLRAVQQGEPPVVARKSFDLASLAEMETDADSGRSPRGKTIDITPEDGEGESIFNSPLLWVAVSGWLVAVILLVVLISI